MRVLFATAHFGFLRNFESALRELAERGHEVRLLSDREESMGGQEIVNRLLTDFDTVSVADGPRQKGSIWHAFARGLRLCIDYLPYLTPTFAEAPRLRTRAAGQAPRLIVWLGDTKVFGSLRGVALMTRLLKAIERVMPVNRRVREFVVEESPDIVMVTPLLYFGSDQVDMVRAARSLGIPSMLCVGSWDHLTTKGVIHETPDRLTVWNPMQRREAADLHGVSPERVIVTGAQTYDHWFELGPSTSRQQFCATVGLRPDRPYVLYLCSSIFIAPDERRWVEEWLRAIRSSIDPALSQAGVLIRPHPQNARQWADFDGACFGDTAIWPREGANPVGPGSKADYYDTMYHAECVVGLNTSGLIESGIIGRPVFTVLSHPFSSTQAGTLHFQHLVSAGGGLLHAAPDLQQHVDDLARALTAGTGVAAEKSRGFVAGFVRPNGLEIRSTDLFVDAVEECALLQVPPANPQPWWAWPLRPLLLPFAVSAEFVYLMRTGEGEGVLRRLRRGLTEMPRLMAKRFRSFVRMTLHRNRKRALAVRGRITRTFRRMSRSARWAVHRTRKRIILVLRSVAGVPASVGRRIAKLLRRICKFFKVAVWHLIPSLRPRE